MRAFPMDAQAYVGVGAPIRADYYVVSPHIIYLCCRAQIIQPWGVSSEDTPQTPQKHPKVTLGAPRPIRPGGPNGLAGGSRPSAFPPAPPNYTKLWAFGPRLRVIYALGPSRPHIQGP